MRDPSNWIAYVGPFRFPWGQAGSRRVLGVAQSIAHSGRNVVVVSGEPGPPRAERTQTFGNGASIDHVGVGELPMASAGRVEKVRLYADWGLRTVSWLTQQATPPTHVIVYGGACQYAGRLRSWCRWSRVPLIADVVEWYDPRQLAGGRFGPSYLSSEVALRYHYPRCDGIIAISSFLSDHYRRRRRAVVTVPPTLDVEGIDLGGRPVGTENHLSLVYCGTPGVKDCLGEIVRGVQKADPDRSRLSLLIAGPSPAEVLGLIGRAALPSNVTVLGRISQPDVGKLIQSADFSLLLRQPARFTQAGFPTKYVESMANGTPVILNVTSDLAAHSVDGQDSLLCEGATSGALCGALRRALSLSAAELVVMRNMARRRAVRSFHYSVYSAGLEHFLSRMDVR